MDAIPRLSTQASRIGPEASTPTVVSDPVIAVVLVKGGSGHSLIAEMEEIVSALVGEVLDLAPVNEQRLPAAPSQESGVEISDAEARVLRYLPTNLTAPEIAAELCVSVHTVKTHLMHIYSKLDVHRRRDAVDRARELGLLSSSTRARNDTPPSAAQLGRRWRAVPGGVALLPPGAGS